MAIASLRPSAAALEDALPAFGARGMALLEFSADLKDRLALSVKNQLLQPVIDGITLAVLFRRGSKA